MKTTWLKFEPVKCDLCNKNARWKHPEGGLRCNDCPRPEKKLPKQPRPEKV
jgi:hypothetical protein